MKLFTKPSLVQKAADELYEAQCSLLKAQSGKAYAEAMVTYHEAQVERLKAFIQSNIAEKSEQELLSGFNPSCERT